MAPKKVQFMQQVQAASTKLAQALEECSSIASVYTDRGYATEGANPITEADLIGHEVTPEELQAFVAFVVALNSIGSAVPELLGYSALLNSLRTDR